MASTTTIQPILTVNERVLCYHGPLRVIYEAKVLKSHHDESTTPSGQVEPHHYEGWKQTYVYFLIWKRNTFNKYLLYRWDEGVPVNRLLTVLHVQVEPLYFSEKDLILDMMLAIMGCDNTEVIGYLTCADSLSLRTRRCPCTCIPRFWSSVTWAWMHSTTKASQWSGVFLFTDENQSSSARSTPRSWTRRKRQWLSFESISLTRSFVPKHRISSRTSVLESYYWWTSRIPSSTVSTISSRAVQDLIVPFVLRSNSRGLVRHRPRLVYGMAISERQDCRYVLPNVFTQNHPDLRRCPWWGSEVPHQPRHRPSHAVDFEHHPLTTTSRHMSVSTSK